MPVVVDPDSSVIATLLTALPPGAHGVESLDRLGPWLDHRTDEYLVVLGPTLAFEEALPICDRLRFTRPSVQRGAGPRTSSTPSVLTQAMHAGARDVVATARRGRHRRGGHRAHQLCVALRGPGGPAHMGQVISVFSPKGGVGQDHDGGQPRADPGRPGATPGLPGRPRPRVRRRRDHDAAVPVPLDRARHRHRGAPSTTACSTGC